MDDFIADMVEALVAVGIAPEAARLGFSEIETALISPSTFAACLKGQSDRLRPIVESAIGSPVLRLLITPVPDYLLTAIPALMKAFPEVVLADKFKAGTVISGQNCVTLDEALAATNPFDAYLIGTVDQKLGRMFRDRLPPNRTIAAAELVWFDPVFRSRSRRSRLVEFHREIAQSQRPLLVLTAYLDATLGPTLEALAGQGHDVFILTRREFSPNDGHAGSDPSVLGAQRHYSAEFDEMIWLLRHTKGCPVVVNYARFLASHWDMRNTIPLFAYSIAILKSISGPRILHLYDAYQICRFGLEVEQASFALYWRLLDLADGVIVNADVAPVLEKVLGPGKPIIDFLRFGPDAEPQADPDPGPFSIVMITGFLGEWDDPTRMTVDAVRSILRQEIDVHYYSSAPLVRDFMDTLPVEERKCFHHHQPIRDQTALIREISKYHAGWFVADMRSCERLSENFTTSFARSLADAFIPTTVATAGILYGCAGLPTIFNTGHYTARLFPPGTTLEISLDETEFLAARIAESDWPAMRRSAFEARHTFMVGQHIRRLVAWLGQFYSA